MKERGVRVWFTKKRDCIYWVYREVEERERERERERESIHIGVLVFFLFFNRWCS